MSKEVQERKEGPLKSKTILDQLKRVSGHRFGQKQA